MNTSQTRSNQGNQHTKTTAIASKFILQKISDNPSFNFAHQYTNQSTIQLYHHPPWGAHLGRANAPGRSPGSRTLRESSTTRWNNFTWLTWGEKCDTIILSKKCESLSLAKEKSLSQWEIKRYNERKSTLPKAGRHEGLKILFWRQSMGLPPLETLKISEMFVDSNDSGLFLFIPFSGSAERARGIFREKRRSLSRA